MAACVGQDLLVDSATGSVAQRKAAIEHRDKQGRTPIVLAASRGSFLMTKLVRLLRMPLSGLRDSWQGGTCPGGRG